MADADFKIFADGKAAEAELIRLGKRVDTLTARLKHSGKQSKDSSNAAITALGQWGTSLLSVNAIYGTVSKSIQRSIDLNREFMREVDDAGRRAEEREKQFNIQSGLRGLKGKEAQQKILDTGFVQAVLPDPANEAAVQLVSSGFKESVVTDGALEEFLKVLNAANVRGANVETKGLAQALTSYLNSQKLELTAENLAMVGQGFQQEFKTKNLQLVDLEQFAREGAAFRGSMTPAEQIGTFAQLRQSVPGERATIGMRNFKAILEGSAEKTRSREMLKRMGLKPQDVDFVGEDVVQILDRLAAGVERLPEEKRKGTLQSLFGMENASVAMQMISDRREIEQAIAEFSNTKDFDADVAEATSGVNAALRRQQIDKARRRAEEWERSGDLGLLLDEADAQAEREGFSPFQRDAMRWTAELGVYLGIDRERSVRWAYSTGELEASEIGGRRGAGARSMENTQQLQKASEEQTQVLKDIRGFLERNRAVLRRDAQTEK